MKICMYFLHFLDLFVLFFFFVDVLLTPIFLFGPHVSQFNFLLSLNTQQVYVILVFLSLFVIYKADVIVKPVLLLVRQSSVLR